MLPFSTKTLRKPRKTQNWFSCFRDLGTAPIQQPPIILGMMRKPQLSVYILLVKGKILYVLPEKMPENQFEKTQF